MQLSGFVALLSFRFYLLARLFERHNERWYQNHNSILRSSTVEGGLATEDTRTSMRSRSGYEDPHNDGKVCRGISPGRVSVW